jgi:hypothetical protein
MDLRGTEACTTWVRFARGCGVRRENPKLSSRISLLGIGRFRTGLVDISVIHSRGIMLRYHWLQLFIQADTENGERYIVG